MGQLQVKQLNEDYAVAANDVLLTVEYGYAQIGGGVAKLDGREIAASPITNQVVGNGAALKGKKLLVKSVVADANDTTNKVSVVYKLTGGQQDQTFISEGEVEDDGDPMAFYGFFKFT
jgi:hypothetical protein